MTNGSPDKRNTIRPVRGRLQTHNNINIAVEGNYYHYILHQFPAVTPGQTNAQPNHRYEHQVREKKRSLMFEPPLLKSFHALGTLQAPNYKNRSEISG